jgi:MoaA/NifB/PqqE/SkfB family radical SAM enzyme
VEKYRTGDRKTLCPWPFERAFVSSDLRVVPCCYIGNPDIIQIGSTLTGQETITDVWRSEAYKEFRRAHLTGNIPTVCKGCYASEE